MVFKISGKLEVDTGGGCPGKIQLVTMEFKMVTKLESTKEVLVKIIIFDHCINGIQDFRETGVDEGDCDPCPECPEGEICECPLVPLY